MSDIIAIALNKLDADPKNVRKTYTKESIESLSASILANGVIQNLVVRKAPKGRYLVTAGGRRLAALNLLAERGEITADYAVNVIVREAGDATELSLTENVMREAMLGSVLQLSCWVRTAVTVLGDIHGHIEEGRQTSGSSVPAAKRGQRLRRRRHYKLVHEVQARSCTSATWRTGEREGNPSHSKEKSAPEALRSR